MIEKKLVTINSRKFDGTVHRSWTAELLEENDDYFLFLGVFDAEVKHSSIGVIRRNTVSYEYYWKNKWFNIFRFHEPEGDLRNFYCNVNQPPVLNDGILDYVDLDIDLLIWKDRTFEILDMDEFKANIKGYDYSVQIQDQAYSSLGDLIQMVERQEFPFDYQGW
jgi:uncharacterized protein